MGLGDGEVWGVQVVDGKGFKGVVWCVWGGVGGGGTNEDVGCNLALLSLQ